MVYTLMYAYVDEPNYWEVFDDYASFEEVSAALIREIKKDIEENESCAYYIKVS